MERQQQWQYILSDSAFAKEITEGLTPRQTYVVNVQAYNFFGGGPWSLPAFVFMEIGTEMLLPLGMQRKSLCWCSHWSCALSALVELVFNWEYLEYTYTFVNTGLYFP